MNSLFRWFLRFAAFAILAMLLLYFYLQYVETQANADAPGPPPVPVELRATYADPWTFSFPENERGTRGARLVVYLTDDQFRGGVPTYSDITLRLSDEAYRGWRVTGMSAHVRSWYDIRLSVNITTWPKDADELDWRAPQYGIGPWRDEYPRDYPPTHFNVFLFPVPGVEDRIPLEKLPEHLTVTVEARRFFDINGKEEQ